MDLATLVEELPFAQHLGIEMEYAEDGAAAGALDLEPHHSSTPGRTVAHGGVTYSLADTVGGAAVVSVTGDVAPTIDMRMDYLAPATDGRIRAEAEVIRIGDSVGTVDVEVTGDGERIATARGVYKTGGGDGETAWASEREHELLREGRDPRSG